MHSDLVSIIVPVYNTEKYIDDCLLSILNQTYQNIEIIIINDGSTDNSIEVCKKYASDSRVILIDRENRGLSRTRQEGIEQSHGVYICTLDSDDLMEPTYIEHMLKQIKKYKADICVCGRKDLNKNKETILLLPTGELFYETTKEMISASITELSRILWLPDSWNKVYKTQFILEANVKFFLDNQYNGTDLVFNYLLFMHCPRYCVCNEPLLVHRIVAGSRVNRMNKPLQEGFEIITEKIINEAVKLDYPSQFFDNFVVIYFRWLKMILDVIISESKTFAELVERYHVFYDHKDAFEKKCTQLKPNAKVSSEYIGIYERILFNSIVNKSDEKLYLMYKLNKIVRVKNSLRRIIK